EARGRRDDSSRSRARPRPGGLRRLLCFAFARLAHGIVARVRRDGGRLRKGGGRLARRHRARRRADLARDTRARPRGSAPVTVVGGIGSGRAGGRHAGLLRERGCEIVVTDPDGAHAAAADAAGYTAVTEPDLFDRADIVVIASPNHVHAAQLETAVAAGCDVLIEKPLAIAPVPEVAVSLDRARAAGQVVGVGCNLRFVPAIEACRDRLAARAIRPGGRASADFADR